MNAAFSRDPQGSARYLLEVACESVADALAAAAGGADRIELCSALDLEGLTPSTGLYHEVRAAVRLPVWVMIRPRAGDFAYSDSELAVMVRDITLFRTATPAGFVFGVLREDGRVHTTACRRLLAACGGVPAVFHRAFDRTPDPDEALTTLIDLGFRRVLTSGGARTGVEGAQAVARLRRSAAGRIEVLPGGKVRSSHLEELLRATGCDQVHGSFAGPGRVAGARVCRDLVAAARAELDRLAGLVSSPP